VCEELGVEAIQIIQKIVNTSTDLLAYLDADRIYRYVNDRHIQFWGKSREEIIGKSIADLLGDEVYTRQVKPKLDKCFAGETVHDQAWFTSVDQGQRCMDVSYFTRKEHGEVVGVMLQGRDITENRRIEEALLESERRYKSLSTDLPVLVCTFLPDSTLTYVNTAYANFFQKTPEELIGKPWLEFLPKEERKNVRKRYMSLTPDNPQQTNEYLNLDQGGETWQEWMDKAFFDDNGAIVSFQAVGIDVTHRKQAEEQVLESESTLRDILNALQAAILIIDPRTMTVVDVNGFGEQLFGEPKETLLGRRCQKLPWVSGCGQAVTDCPLLQRAVLAQEFHIQRPDGKITPVSKTVITSKLNGSPHLYEILLDLTRQKDMERQLTHAQKMESIGQLAAGVAHELNTPIQYVGDNIYFLQQAFANVQNLLQTVGRILESCPAEAHKAFQEAKNDAKMNFLTDQIPRAIEQSLDGASRVGSIVKAMKKFSHPGNEEQKLTDINAAIENTVIVTRNEWKYHADIKLELSPNLPTIPCYPGELNMALLNIVVNAAHAIGEKVGETEEKGLITIHSSHNDEFVEISIEDTGTGIPAIHQKRIFDPFFTTKEVGKGTGQGLATAYDVIVNKHGGDIQFHTQEAVGTTFVIRLPCAGGNAI
jgi:PAS domain S-box-containing protein